MQGWAREAGHSITNAVGIDVAKMELVVAVSGHAAMRRYANDATGRRRLCRDLAMIAGSQSLRIGLEASGGYERKIVSALRKAGFAVIVFQPIQVRAYAQYLGQRAKTDPIDARLIALATAAHEGEIRHGDERLTPLAEHLTLLEQIEEDLVRLKTRRDGFTVTALKSKLEAEIKRLTARRNAEIRGLLKSLRLHSDLAFRLDLVASIDGIGERTALTLIIRMPELGTMTREEAASLAGLAPFDDQTGKTDRLRHIKAGRAKVRRSLYAAALPAAFKWNKALVDIYHRLTAKGAPHKKALIACARKLLIFANTVLARGTPWIKSTATT
jgi:transposase